VPIRAVRGAVTQIDSRLVRQQCTMSGRTAVEAACSQHVFITVNERVGRLPSDQDLHCALASSIYTARAVATQHRRVRERRSFPGKRVSTTAVMAQPP
jgi:hypothetical protein